MKEHAPPQWASRFFRWYCHRAYLEDIEGDLLERYQLLVADKGQSEANRKYIREVLLLFRPGIIRPVEGSLKLNNYGMLKNYFKTGWRNIKKQKVFSAINIAGLSVGIACGLMILLYVSNELSYDTYHTKYHETYRILHAYRNAEAFEANPEPAPEDFQVWGGAMAGPTFMEEFSAVTNFCRFTSPFELLFEVNGKRIQENNMIFADSSVFDIFSWRLLSGDPTTALKEPNSIVLTRATAQKYFGEEDPVGRSITIDQQTEFQVTGVMENVPANSHFTFPGLISMSTFHAWRPDIFEVWDYVDYYTYFTVSDTSAIPQIRAALPGIREKYLPDYTSFALEIEPLSDAYLYSQAGRQPGETGNYNNIYLFSFIAILILAVAAVNYMNMSTARSMERAREIGVRKSVGAHKSSLITQFMLETLLITFLSAIAGIVLTGLCLPLLNRFSGKEMELTSLYTIDNLLLFTGGLLLLSLLAGIYPSFMLSSFRPASVLKGSIGKLTGGMTFRKALVVFQFTLSIGLIAGTAIVYSQLNYMLNHPLGFDQNHKLVLDFGWDSGVQQRVESIKQSLKEIPGVLDVSATRAVPGDFLPGAGTAIESAEGTFQNKNPGIYEVDPDFIPLYKIKLVAGRNFSADFVTDSTEALILNEAAAEFYGYSDPKQIIGKKYSQWGNDGYVIGVVENFNYQSLHSDVEPLSIRFAPRYSLTKLTLSISGLDVSQTVERIREEWSTLVPNRPFLYTFLDDSFNTQYQRDVRFSSIFTAFAGISIFIACLGLLGLTMYTIQLRRKEIGIRKILGASVQGIIGLLSRGYGIIFLISCILAVPLAWFGMERWLQGFAYRMQPGPWIFIIAAFITLAIAILTISVQSFKAAYENPVNALKDE
jgi:putative ABC transport system permease protein